MYIRRACLVLLIPLWIVACSSTFNVPAVTEGKAVATLPGKIIWHDLLTDTPKRSEAFYSQLFGWEFESLPEGDINYRLIRHQGQLIGGLVDENRLPNRGGDISQWVILMAVVDIDLASAAVTAGGGKVLTAPTSLGERGDIAVVSDPRGALFALLQTRSGEPADSADVPPPGGFLWNELWTDDVDVSSTFYRSLAPFRTSLETLGRDSQPVDYRVLSTGDKPRAGIRPNPVEGTPQKWMSYLRVADGAALASLLDKVEGLGGAVLMPATERPAGGLVAVIAGPSGAPVVLQTWPVHPAMQPGNIRNELHSGLQESEQ